MSLVRDPRQFKNDSEIRERNCRCANKFNMTKRLVCRIERYSNGKYKDNICCLKEGGLGKQYYDVDCFVNGNTNKKGKKNVL